MVALTPRCRGGDIEKSGAVPLIDKNFASRLGWNLMRTFVDIVHGGGIGPAARTRTPLSGPRVGGGRNGTDLKWAGFR